MENLRLYGCALTNGSNNLTNNLSVTAFTRLIPVFLMMIFLGIGTDVLGQQRALSLELQSSLKISSTHSTVRQTNLAR